MSPRDTGRSTEDEHQGSPSSAEDEQKLAVRCRNERDEMTPRETADCAGADLSELYNTEEDGGS